MVTFGMLASGTVILSVYGAEEILQTNWNGLTLLIWGTIVYLAVFATSLSFLCLQFASMHLPATNVMAYTYLTPIWVLVLGEALCTMRPRRFGSAAVQCLVNQFRLSSSYAHP